MGPELTVGPDAHVVPDLNPSRRINDGRGAEPEVMSNRNRSWSGKEASPIHGPIVTDLEFFSLHVHIVAKHRAVTDCHVVAVEDDVAAEPDISANRRVPGEVGSLARKGAAGAAANCGYYVMGALAGTHDRQ
jgi:hypothetical protein